MQTARVIGNAHATVKHASLQGRRMLILQPLDIRSAADGCPVLAIDTQGAGIGDSVLFTSDGAAIRDIVGRRDSPVRFAVIAIPDAD